MEQRRRVDGREDWPVMSWSMWILCAGEATVREFSNVALQEWWIMARQDRSAAEPGCTLGVLLLARRMARRTARHSPPVVARRCGRLAGRRSPRRLSSSGLWPKAASRFAKASTPVQADADATALIQTWPLLRVVCAGGFSRRSFHPRTRAEAGPWSPSTASVTDLPSSRPRYWAWRWQRAGFPGLPGARQFRGLLLLGASGGAAGDAFRWRRPGIRFFQLRRRRLAHDRAPGADLRAGLSGPGLAAQSQGERVAFVVTDIFSFHPMRFEIAVPPDFRAARPGPDRLERRPAPGRRARCASRRRSRPPP